MIMFEMNKIIFNDQQIIIIIIIIIIIYEHLKSVTLGIIIGKHVLPVLGSILDRSIVTV